MSKRRAYSPYRIEVLEPRLVLNHAGTGHGGNERLDSMSTHTLVSNQVAPFQDLTIMAHLVPSAPTTVTFTLQGLNKQTIQETPNNMASNGLDVGVPVLISQKTGDPISGVARVTVTQQVDGHRRTITGFRKLTIGELPASSLPPGSVLLQWIGQIQDALIGDAAGYASFLSDVAPSNPVYSVLSRDLAPLFAQLQAASTPLSGLQQLITSIQTGQTPQVYLGTEDGTSVTLDLQSLGLIDRLLLAEQDSFDRADNSVDHIDEANTVLGSGHVAGRGFVTQTALGVVALAATSASTEASTPLTTDSFYTLNVTMTLLVGGVFGVGTALLTGNPQAGVAVGVRAGAWTLAILMTTEAAIPAVVKYGRDLIYQLLGFPGVASSAFPGLISSVDPSIERGTSSVLALQQPSAQGQTIMEADSSIVNLYDVAYDPQAPSLSVNAKVDALADQISPAGTSTTGTTTTGTTTTGTTTTGTTTPTPGGSYYYIDYRDFSDTTFDYSTGSFDTEQGAIDAFNQVLQAQQLVIQYDLENNITPDPNQIISEYRIHQVTDDGETDEVIQDQQVSASTTSI